MSELINFLDSMEIIVLIASCVLLVLFLWRWYRPLIKALPMHQNFPAKIMLGFLPVVSFVMIFIVLNFFASFDVVDSAFYKFFYIVLGYAWLFAGLGLMSLCFGLFCPDDAVHFNNKAALAAIIGEVFALTSIYAGANIGDGPGWWCVIFAGGLGLAAWLVLSFIFHFFTGIFERITVERDFGSGIRFCLYLMLSGIILGYACSGDWTSFSKTAEEFLVGWSVLPLTTVMILIERFFQNREKTKGSP